MHRKFWLKASAHNLSVLAVLSQNIFFPGLVGNRTRDSPRNPIFTKKKTADLVENRTRDFHDVCTVLLFLIKTISGIVRQKQLYCISE